MVQGIQIKKVQLVVLACIAAIVTSGCSREDKKLAAGGVIYTFPSEDVFRFTMPGKGYPFARIRSEGGPSI